MASAANDKHTCQVKAPQVGRIRQRVGDRNGARGAKLVACQTWRNNSLANNNGFYSQQCMRTCNIQLSKFHQMAECARKCCSTIVLDVVLCHTRLGETAIAPGGLN